MSVTLKTTVGTINFTDWLHVTAAKVLPGGGAGAVEWETWIDVPVANYSFIIPDLDPVDYLISFYDAPTNVALGTLQLQIIVNALTSEWQYERRFYTVDGPGTYDPVAGDLSITDPYLIGKNVTGVFKEGFRYYVPTVETDFNDTTGVIDILTGVALSNSEVMSVEIKYSVATPTAVGGGGLYSGLIDVTEATRTLIAGEKNKCLRLVGSAATQVITLPAVTALNEDEGYYFDNSLGGVAKCVKILCQAGQEILFNGFNSASNSFPEFWVGQGEHLLLKRYGTKWEVRCDYKGTNVGQIIVPGTTLHPMAVYEQNQLMDGNEWGRMWWWINNVLPAASKYVTDTVVSGGFTHTANRRAQFALHSTLKKFRMPSTGGLVLKGLANMATYGTDTTNRPVDAPGGIQDQQLQGHAHKLVRSTGFLATLPVKAVLLSGDNGGGYEPGLSTSGTLTEYVGGVEGRVTNSGVIYARCM